MSLLSINNLTIHFPRENNYVVQNFSYSLNSGEVLGIVGESGCGKSISSYAIMGLLPREARIRKGSIMYKTTNLLTISKEEHRRLRTTDLAMIFQNPMCSLNPYLTIETQITESLRRFKKDSRKIAKQKTQAILERVCIPDPLKIMKCFSHELSGGMCQRVMIAMMVVLEPKLLIADEPTTALDVTVQAQILALLSDMLKESKREMAMILISHDIGVISNMADNIVVMYAGGLMESGPSDDVLTTPFHPYTESLLNSAPDIQDVRGPLKTISGSPPFIHEKHTCCPFATRCPYVQDSCNRVIPPIETLKTQSYSCLFPLKKVRSR